MFTGSWLLPRPKASLEGSPFPVADGESSNAMLIAVTAWADFVNSCSLAIENQITIRRCQSQAEKWSSI